MGVVRLQQSPRAFAALLIIAGLSGRVASTQQSFDSPPSQTAPANLDRQLRADMAFLADDALHGRGSATRDEHIAALYAASRFQALGLTPGGLSGSYIQTSPLPARLPDEALESLARSHSEGVPRTETWNAIAILRGTAAPEEVILLTAHLDHLGIGAPNAAGDTIYNGADDDASGTSAVLALAQTFAQGPRPRRTIVFALFGSEELGGFGNAAFLAHPPIPLGSIIGNLEFEMIGRRDPALAHSPFGPDALFLTGFDRSDLGRELARHGAPLVPDPHPAENFFQRSDNYPLALQGIVAHTVTSFGLHKDYHQPSDSLDKIDFAHLSHAVTAMSTPIKWLADTTWHPSWTPTGRP